MRRKCGSAGMLSPQGATPFPASEMTSHAVGYEVNHTKIDDESLLTPVEPNLGVTRRLF